MPLTQGAPRVLCTLGRAQPYKAGSILLALPLNLLDKKLACFIIPGLEYSLRVISTCGDGDCGADKIDTRAKFRGDVALPSRRVFSKFRACVCVCISPAPRSGHRQN